MVFRVLLQQNERKLGVKFKIFDFSNVWNKDRQHLRTYGTRTDSKILQHLQLQMFQNPPQLLQPYSNCACPGTFATAIAAAKRLLKLSIHHIFTRLELVFCTFSRPPQVYTKTTVCVPPLSRCCRTLCRLKHISNFKFVRVSGTDADVATPPRGFHSSRDAPRRRRVLHRGYGPSGG